MHPVTDNHELLENMGMWALKSVQKPLKYQPKYPDMLKNRLYPAASRCVTLIRLSTGKDKRTYSIDKLISSIRHNDWNSLLTHFLYDLIQLTLINNE